MYYETLYNKGFFGKKDLCCGVSAIVSLCSMCQLYVFLFAMVNDAFIICYFILALLIQSVAIIISCFTFMNSVEKQQHIKSILCVIFSNISLLVVFFAGIFFIGFATYTWELK